jgi:cell division protein FtsQ
MEDGEDDPERSDWRRARNKFDVKSGHWWWPASVAGRVFVGLGALVVIVGFSLTVDLCKTYLQRDARFRITGASHIQAAGLTEVTRAQLVPVFGEDVGRNIFFVPLNERRKELEAIPWIQRATVMRLLPDQIRVDVVERKPVAFTRHGQQIGLVDASGVLLDMPPAAMAAHHYSFPVITGIDAGDRPASRQARMAVYERLMNELDANGQHYSDQISEIDLTDPEDASVLMPEPGADILAHFGEDHFLERYQRYKAHIAEWRQQYPKLAAIDLRYEHQVVLEMASGVTQPQAEANAGGDQTELKAAPDKPSAKGPATKPAKSKAAAKTKVHTKAKSNPARQRTEQEKKRAQVRNTALKMNKTKASSPARQLAAEGQ